MNISLRCAGDTDRSHIASLFARLIVDLDAAHGGDDLRPLVRICDAALEEAIAVARAPAREPRSPPGQELARLVELLLTADPRTVVGVLRQLRRALGRLDACIG